MDACFDPHARALIDRLGARVSSCDPAVPEVFDDDAPVVGCEDDAVPRLPPSVAGL